jgi:hypothetical protein
MEDLIGPLTLLLLFYLIPTIIAVIRGHRSVWAIAFVNVVLGWSVIGWLWAMIWALSGRHGWSYRQPLDDYRRPDAEGPTPSWRAIERHWASSSRENPFRSDPQKELGRKADLN